MVASKLTEKSEFNNGVWLVERYAENSTLPGNKFFKIRKCLWPAPPRATKNILLISVIITYKKIYE